MTSLYSDSDLWEALKQKRRILAVFFAVTGAFLLGFVALTVFYILLPYEDPRGKWLIAATCVLTALYLIFVFPYMGISFKRSRAYCKMLNFISVGLKECSVLPFNGVEDWTTHDGVDVNVAIFAIHNIKRDEVMLRQIYVDGEKDFPAFEEGKHVRLVTQGNLLIEYEILE